MQNWLENAIDKTDKSPAPRQYGSMALYIYLIKTNVTPGTMLQALEIWSLNETLARITEKIANYFLRKILAFPLSFL